MRMESIFELNINQAQFQEVHAKLEEIPIPMDIFDLIHTNVEILLTETVRLFEQDLEKKEYQEVDESKLEGREERIFGFLRKRKESVDETGLQKQRPQTDRQYSSHSNSMMRLFKFSNDETFDKKRILSQAEDEKLMNSLRKESKPDMSKRTSDREPDKEQKAFSLLEMLQEDEEPQEGAPQSIPKTIKQMFVYNRNSSADLKLRPMTDRGNKKFIDSPDRSRSQSDASSEDMVALKQSFTELKEDKTEEKTSSLSEMSQKEESVKVDLQKSQILKNEPKEEEKLISPKRKKEPMSFLEMLQADGEEEEEEELKNEPQSKTKKQPVKSTPKNAENSRVTKEVPQVFDDKVGNDIEKKSSSLGFLEMLQEYSTPRKDSEEVVDSKEGSMSFLEMLQNAEKETDSKKKVASKKTTNSDAHPPKVSKFFDKLRGNRSNSLVDSQIGEGKARKANVEKTKPNSEKKSQKSFKEDKSESPSSPSSVGFLDMLRDAEEKPEKPMSLLEMLKMEQEEEEEEARRIQQEKTKKKTFFQKPKKSNEPPKRFFDRFTKAKNEKVDKKESTRSLDDGTNDDDEPLDFVAMISSRGKSTSVDDFGFVEKPKKKPETNEENPFEKLAQEKKSLQEENPFEKLAQEKLKSKQEPEKSLQEENPFEKLAQEKLKKSSIHSEENPFEKLAQEKLKKSSVHSEENPFEKLAQEKLIQKQKEENPFEKLAQEKLNSKTKEENPFEKLAQQKLKENSPEKLAPENLKTNVESTSEKAVQKSPKDENPFEKLAQEKLRKTENPFEKLAQEKLKTSVEENPFEKLAREKLKAIPKEENPFEKLAQQKLKEKEENPFEKLAQEKLKTKQESEKSLQEENPFEKLAQEKLKTKQASEKSLQEENPFEKLAQEKLKKSSIHSEENPFEKLAQEKMKEKDNSFKKLQENPFEKLAREKLAQVQEQFPKKEIEENPFERLYREKMKEAQMKREQQGLTSDDKQTTNVNKNESSQSEIVKKTNDFLQEIKDLRPSSTVETDSKTSNLDLIFDKIKKSREKSKAMTKAKDDSPKQKSPKEDMSSKDSPKEGHESNFQPSISDAPLSPPKPHFNGTEKVYTPKDNADMRKLRLANRKYSQTRKLLIRTPTIHDGK